MGWDHDASPITDAWDREPDRPEPCAAPGCEAEGTERIDTGDILTSYYCADHADEAKQIAAWQEDPSRCEAWRCLNEGTEPDGYCPLHTRTRP